MKKALIIGISGQDGSLLAKHLLENNYKVYGTSRDYELTSFNGLKKLGIFDKVELQSMILNDFRSVIKAIDVVRPDEIYNLAGQTSVGFSFLQPVETIESIINGCLNVLETVKFLKLDCKIFNPCSSECFGESTDNSKESTPFNPLSPYAVAKTSAYWLTSNYRKSYGIYTCSGILSNHESVLRNERFVTMKIINSAKRIYEGVQNKLELGNISIVRDWGCAEEYVKAMHLMLQQENPEDMIISTNKSISLEEFIDYTFKKYNLDYQKHIIINNDLIRPNDIKVSRLSNNKIFDRLGWKPQNNVYDVIDKLVNSIN
jgi:GDPmannose 4,6-dehydratase